MSIIIRRIGMIGLLTIFGGTIFGIIYYSITDDLFRKMVLPIYIVIMLIFLAIIFGSMWMENEK